MLPLLCQIPREILYLSRFTKKQLPKYPLIPELRSISNNNFPNKPMSLRSDKQLYLNYNFKNNECRYTHIHVLEGLEKSKDFTYGFLQKAHGLVFFCQLAILLALNTTEMSTLNRKLVSHGSPSLSIPPASNPFL